MPVYEYECKGCGHQFEREQRISDPPLEKCPSCGASKARRLISRTSFVLKGGGWYSDLYGAAKPAKASEEAKPDAAPAKDADAKEAKPSAAKPAADARGEPSGPGPGKPPKKGGKGTKAAA
jgi:putative FmdB family regulatory protein